MCISCRSRPELSNEYLVFTCKHRLRYSQERASPSLPNITKLLVAKSEKKVRTNIGNKQPRRQQPPSRRRNRRGSSQVRAGTQTGRLSSVPMRCKRRPTGCISAIVRPWTSLRLNSQKSFTKWSTQINANATFVMKRPSDIMRKASLIRIS